MATITPEAIGLAALRLKYRKQQASIQSAAYEWPRHARENQLPPDGDWTTWLFLAGRGTGKTRAGAEYVRARIESGTVGRGALIGPTAADVRDVMIEGESGLLAIAPPWNRPHYEPSKRRLTWPNGALATAYSADEPERLRGPQHDFGWCDEPASWRYPDAWDNFMFGLRLGQDPRAVVTGTPKPVKLIRELLGREGRDVVVTRGTTYENRDNLAASFLEQIVQRYEGTRLGRQELMGEMLEDIEGAFWQLSWIERDRVTEPPALTRVVVGIDPAATHNSDSDETGITVAGIGNDGQYYVLNAGGYRLSPQGWAKRALDLFDQFSADRIIAERNNGGEMVEHTIRTLRRDAPVTTIHASRGKSVRAEPVAALYEQGRVHHVGVLPGLEDQYCSFPVSNENDDILDSAVYALTELTERGKRPKVRVSSVSRRG